MAVVLVKVTGSRILVAQPFDVSQLLNSHDIDRVCVWWDAREINGVRLQMHLDLIVDDSGDAPSTLGPNRAFPSLFGDVVLAAYWEADLDDDQMQDLTDETKTHGYLDIRQVISWDSLQVIHDISQAHLRRMIASEQGGDVDARQMMFDSIRVHVKESAWDLVNSDARPLVDMFGGNQE